MENCYCTKRKMHVPGRSEYKRTKFQKRAECLKLINFSSILGLTTVKQAYCNENVFTQNSGHIWKDTVKSYLRDKNSPP